MHMMVRGQGGLQLLYFNIHLLGIGLPANLKLCPTPLADREAKLGLRGGRMVGKIGWCFRFVTRLMVGFTFPIVYSGLKCMN